MNRFFTIIILTTLIFSACASKNTALIDARKSYESAASDPVVKENAPVALYDAELALKRANDAAHGDASNSEVTHLAVLAQKRVEIARIEAQKKQSDTQFSELSKDRNQAVLSAREQEAQDARQRAQALENQASQSEAQARDLAMRNQELQRELSALKMKPTERGMQLTLHDTVFEFGKSELTPGARRDLEKIAQELKKAPNNKILIEGHTDSVGSETYNQQLSQQRADAVRAALSQNIDSSKLMTKGMGEQYPVASNSTEAGRQQNRRVNIIVLQDETNPTHNTNNNMDQGSSESGTTDSQVQPQGTAN